jgi:hypothetical protein
MGIVGAYNCGRTVWQRSRIGYGMWHILDSNFSCPGVGSYHFGNPDTDYVRMLKEAGIKVLRAFAWDWNYFANGDIN